MLKKLIVLTLIATAAASAQWADFAAFTGSTNLSGAMNGKPTVQTGHGAPTAIACGAAGKDLYIDLDLPISYICTVAGSPGTWVIGGLSYFANASNLSSGTLNHARLPALVSADIPNNTASTSGNAGTATAFDHTPTGCGSNQYAQSNAASGNLGCKQVAASEVTGLAASATTNTTIADNITGGTLPNARIVALPNANLQNSAMTLNGVSVALGATATIPAVPVAPSYPAGTQLTYLNFRQADASGQSLIKMSNTFTDAVWTKTGVTVTGGQLDPLGGSTAYKIAEDNSTGWHLIAQSITGGINPFAAYTGLAYVHTSTGDTRFQFRNADSGDVAAVFNISTCAVISAAGGTATAAAGANGYCIFTYTYQSAFTSSRSMQFGPASSSSGGQYTGVTGNGVLVWHTWYGTGSAPPATWTDTPLPSYTVTDQSGNGNNCTAVGGVQISPNYGMTFTGAAGQYVSCAAASASKGISVTVDTISPVNGVIPNGPVFGNLSGSNNWALAYSQVNVGNATYQYGRWTLMSGGSVVQTTVLPCAGPKVVVTAIQSYENPAYTQLFCNGFEMFVFAGPTTFGNGGTLTIGADPVNAASYTGYFTGTIYNVSAWNFTPSKQQIQAWAQFSVADALSKGVVDPFNPVATYYVPAVGGSAPLGGVLVCIGDSIAAGYGITNSFCSSANSSFTPTLPYTTYQWAVSGEQLQSTVLRIYPGPNGLLPFLFDFYGTNAAAQVKATLLQGGTNDLQNGVPAATVAASMWQGVTYAKKTYPGSCPIVSTVISRTGLDATIVPYNHLIRNNWRAMGACQLFDPAAIAGLSPNGTNNAGGNYQAEHVHPNQTGANLMAAELTKILNRITTDAGPVTFGTPAPGICHGRYSYVDDGGAVSTMKPITNCAIPVNSAIEWAVVNWSGATGAGASASVGLNGTGGSTTVLQGSLAVGSLTGETFNGPITGNVKLTTSDGAGAVSVTVTGSPLASGICDVTVRWSPLTN